MRDIASIVGLKVISSKEGREIGAVSQVIVNLASAAVEGLIVGTGPSEKGIEAKDIEVLGQDAVMVGTYKVARHLSELPGLMEKRRDAGAGPREVITDTGNRLGILGAIHIDPANLRVTRYEASGGTWRDITEGVLSLPPMEGTVDGRDSIVVPTAALEAVSGSSGGLRAQFSKLGGVAREQAKQAGEALDKGAGALKRGVSDVGGKAAAAAAKVKEAGEGAATKAKSAAAQLGAENEEKQQSDQPTPDEADKEEASQEKTEEGSDKKSK
jgi:uncharacterized protein YrrD